MTTYKNKKQLDKSAISYELIIPKDELQKAYDSAAAEAIKTVKIEGFRPGKAPKAMAEKHLNREKVYNDAPNSILPELVQDLVRRENLTPLVTPKLKLLSGKEGEDWSIEVIIVQRPAVKLPDLKKLVSKAKSQLKKEDITQDTDSDEEKNRKQSLLLNAILDQLVKGSAVEISQYLIEDEYEKRLANLLDEVHKLGLTIEKYAASKQLTVEDLKSRIKEDLTSSYALEFLFDEIGEKNKIIVEQKDLETLYTSVEDEKKADELKNNAYMYAGLLRRQKILDFLVAL